MKFQSIFNTLRTRMNHWFGASQSSAESGPSDQTQQHSPEGKNLTGSALEHGKGETGSVPYDENLLEKARTQWQFGDWESLAKLERDLLQHHPDRAKLALLAGAGRMQVGHTHAARHYLRLAEDWGCSRKLISRVVISGVHNSLGRAASLLGQTQRAQLHFEDSIRAGMPQGEIRLVTLARIQHQSTLVLERHSISPDPQEPVSMPRQSPNTAEGQ